MNCPFWRVSPVSRNEGNIPSVPEFREMIHREISRALGPPPSLATTRCEKHCRGELCLDSAFVLIEGYPPGSPFCASADHPRACPQVRTIAPQNSVPVLADDCPARPRSSEPPDLKRRDRNRWWLCAQRQDLPDRQPTALCTRRYKVRLPFLAPISELWRSY